MSKRFYHRGYNIELVDQEKGLYRARLAGKNITGSLVGIKQSIDWWAQTKILRDPDDFAKQEFATAKESRMVEYKGFKLINDTATNENEWYFIVRGNLLKGSLAVLKKYIDTKM